MINQTEKTECHRFGFFKCISWSAIIIGALVGIGLSFLLNLFSLAIGLTAFTTNDTGMTAVAIGGFLGFVIGTIVSMFVAGYTAGYLGRRYTAGRNLGVIYGFSAWCLALLLMIAFANPVASFVSSYSGYVTDHKRVMINNPYQTPSPSNGMSSAQTEQSANDAGKAGLVLFVLFFLGALSSSFGGYYGMLYNKDNFGIDESRRVDEPRV